MVHHGPSATGSACSSSSGHHHHHHHQQQQHPRPYSSASEAIEAGEVAFITLTNSGYLVYTANLLRTLHIANEPVPLTLYCADGKSFERLCEEHTTARGSPNEPPPRVERMDGERLPSFVAFKGGGWPRLMWLKCEAMRRALETHAFCAFTDGDIVYERSGAIEHCVDLLLDLDSPELLMQKEGVDGKHGACAGFMVARSTPETRAAFTVSEASLDPNWDDQRHLNQLAATGRLKVATLPLPLFPNGQYWAAHKEELAAAEPGPFLIHYNWMVGAEKRRAMAIDGKWFVDARWEEPGRR
jgi:hypothetical protein